MHETDIILAAWIRRKNAECFLPYSIRKLRSIFLPYMLVLPKRTLDSTSIPKG